MSGHLRPWRNPFKHQMGNKSGSYSHAALKQASGLAAQVAVLSITVAIMASTAAAADAPLNYFLHSHGPASRPTLYLGWVLAGLSVVVCLIIALLLITAMLRKRPAADSRVIGQESGGLRWIYIGTGISTCI